MTTDTSELGLERLICTGLTGHPCDPPQEGIIGESRTSYDSAGWEAGDPRHYNREYCVDLTQLSNFLHDTQPEIAESLDLGQDGPTRRKFLARLQGEITKRGTIDVLRHGIKHGAHHLELFYGTPSAGNDKARKLFEQNRFTVSRQLRYSHDETRLALDIALFINGLPVFTFELKNSLTKQTVADAVLQYEKDRNPREKLFSSAAASPTSPSTRARSCSAPTCKVRPRGSCPSTVAGTTAPATRPTRTASRPTTCGARSSPATA